MLSAPPAPLDPASIRSTVENLLCDFLNQQEEAAPDLPELALFTGQLRDMLTTGGKYIRPVLCVAGWLAVSGQTPSSSVWRVAASLELFHTFTLIHDDVMDHSDTRRGRPTAHRALAARHQTHPDSASLGVNAAILLGDLALGWSYELLHHPGLTPHDLGMVRPGLNALRTETLVGQYLDLTATGRPATDARPAWRIIHYKTAQYTIVHPLRLGARLAGATHGQLHDLSAYAVPLGEAFQLRDDLLGVFGDPGHTGKSALDDLREGKQTVLVATALGRSTPVQRHTLQELLGDPHLSQDTADTLRDIFTATGAAAAVEQMIADRVGTAQRALCDADLQPDATVFLHNLASSVADR
ncbi:polyprenyl synthetase family protein [Streptomyces syringium]|uniref:polyprenyl synthetase family protein n=1 Tax=Streptomyces syringium TaxID=76729 RepID=UPI0034537C8E